MLASCFRGAWGTLGLFSGTLRLIAFKFNIAMQGYLGGVLRRRLITGTIGRRLETTQAGPIPTSTPRPVPRGRRIAANLLLSTGVFAIGTGLGLSFAPYINPYSSSEPLYIVSDWNDPTVKAITETLEEKMQSLPIVQKLNADPKWRSSRPYSKLDMEERAHHMTAYALAGPGKIGVTPLLFVDENNTSLVAIIHVGKSLCGHKGFIHGGLLATLLDESMGRIALPNLPSQLGVTANLDINYRLPTKAEQFIVAKTELKKVEGRKCWVEGRLETLDGKVLVDARALFVEPK